MRPRSHDSIFTEIHLIKFNKISIKKTFRNEYLKLYILKQDLISPGESVSRSAKCNMRKQPWIKYLGLNISASV